MPLPPVVLLQELVPLPLGPVSQLAVVRPQELVPLPLGLVSQLAVVLPPEIVPLPLGLVSQLAVVLPEIVPLVLRVLGELPVAQAVPQELWAG